MRINAEKQGRPCRRRALKTARAFLLSGKPSRAMACLDRAAGLVPTEITEWIDDFIFPAVKLASIYERWSLAWKWIRRTEKELKRTAHRDDEAWYELEILKLYVQFVGGGHPNVKAKIEKAFSCVRTWKPWIVDFRWFFLVHEHRMQELERHLLTRPPCPIQRGTLEYAKRLLYLGVRISDLGRTDRAVTVLRAAMRMLQEVSGPESLGQRAIALCFLARAQAQLADFTAAHESVKEAEAIGRRLKRPRFQIMRNQAYSFIYWRSGDYEKGLQVNLESCFALCKKRPFNSSLIALFYFKAARFALILGRLDQARRLGARAARIRNTGLSCLVKGSLHLLKGDLKREAGTPAAFRDAQKHYDLAEASFRSHGTGAQDWLSFLSISRGALYLKEGRIEEALRQADTSLEAGKSTGIVDLQEAGVLLKSFLLLEKEVPRYDIYESVLRNLGAVREPAYLFKVLANLYIYSWDLEDSLELTDLHLKQIEKLRERLSPSIYERLYRTYVTDRVLARLKGRLGVREEKDRKIVSF